MIKPSKPVRALLAFILTVLSGALFSQGKIDLVRYNKKNGAEVEARDKIINISWPAGKSGKGQVKIDMQDGHPLFASLQLCKNGKCYTMANNLDPAFVLTIGKRDLVSQNGWNIFFDKVPSKPFEAFNVQLDKSSAKVVSEGSRTKVIVSKVTASSFSGDLEITFYNGSPLINIAAVMATGVDSTAIIYDGGLVSTNAAWKKIAWTSVDDQLQSASTNTTDTSNNLAVKYRTIIGENAEGSLALFPPPHQYFYPLDECFNLKFVWYGTDYRKMVKGYGIGIRQDLYGDHRFVPWFNAPPHTMQRLNFFCLLASNTKEALANVKQFTHNDTYAPLKGYKTMTSHYHIEHVTKMLEAQKKNIILPDTPSFVNVFKRTGINIVHLAEFHGVGHPTGPDDVRLMELKTLFDMCKRLSQDNFLLLPGEEPNNFFGGHWLDFFPKPVYWIMSRKAGAPFVTQDPTYGKVYRIGDKQDMLNLLKAESGLAWTAHARTKGSTGFPDAYKNEAFFNSPLFFGASWKALPADLSQPRLGKRALDLLDDMANWGLKKSIIGEADLFTIEPEHELYGHININYLQMDKMPAYNQSWQPILDVMRNGKYFVTTGEVLMPSFTINGKGSGDTAILNADGKATVKANLSWTFPLNFIEVVSGDGKNVYREKIDQLETTPFASKTFLLNLNLKGRKWARIEAWDIASNGAFSQIVWLKGN
ncbi:hypothetical protein QEG73_14130 [Chitinophagaceae bacterium 26-R-25]|nr:hypothetical protein [Chitinophagaceae bacterium 26-R-25]